MRTILNLCSGLSGIVAICCIGEVLDFFFDKYIRKKSHRLSFSFGLEDYHTARVIIALATIIGLVNAAASYVFATNQIGAFYERAEYTEFYEAELTIEEDSLPVFCIAEVSHTTNAWEDRGYSRYTVFNLLLPYGRTQFTDCEYDPDSKRNSINLGEYGVSCELRLNKVADSQSYKRLENEILSANGEVVASINGDSYHFEECSHAKNIKRKNLIRFNSAIEAQALGFRVCQDCDHW